MINKWKGITKISIPFHVQSEYNEETITWQKRKLPTTRFVTAEQVNNAGTMKIDILLCWIKLKLVHEIIRGPVPNWCPGRGGGWPAASRPTNAPSPTAGRTSCEASPRGLETFSEIAIITNTVIWMYYYQTKKAKNIWSYNLGTL